MSDPKDVGSSETGMFPVSKTTEVSPFDAAMILRDAIERSRTVEPALIVIEGDLPGQVFRIRPGRQTAGRRPECDIRLRGRAVSGFHAEIMRDPEKVTIHDMGSTNGTSVAGTAIKEPVILTPGVLLKIGNSVFKYVESLLDVQFTESLHNRGITDALTGIYNRPYLIERLRLALESASPERPLSVVLFDLDDFKLVNDRHGHAAGDEVLRQISTMIVDRFIRAGDLLARIGGEEFVLMLPDTSLRAATETAEKIREEIASMSYSFEGQAATLTASFGVCTTTSTADTTDQLLAQGDQLLYASKREGRNRVSTSS